MASEREREAMGRALLLARRGEGATAPNPVVGCVVLDADGDVIGEGWHHRAGGPHAEVEALSAAGNRARGGTAVVTLEPCSHTGRTGPCTQALIDSGIARVVYAVRDPSSVAGGGAVVLREAGLSVEEGLLADQAYEVNEAWLVSMKAGRPMVTLKLASTLDGRIAAADGTSRWISGTQARAEVHELRARCDAVMVGTGTVLTDDPALTVRDVDPSLADRKPLRVVVGLRDLPANAAVLEGPAKTLHVRTHDPFQVLATLQDLGVRHVLVEGGPTLASALLAAGVVDRLVSYVAPVVLGTGASALSDFGATTIGEAVRLTDVQIIRCGDDVRISGRVGTRGQGGGS